jgi:hypothetical protein
MKLTNVAAPFLITLACFACGETDSLGKARTNVDGDPDSGAGKGGDGGTGGSGSGGAAGAGASAGSGGAGGTGAPDSGPAGSGGGAGERGIACLVGGVRYEHGATLKDPFSCNRAGCDNGQVIPITKIGCDEACPPNRVNATRCAECGPADECLLVETGCLLVCSEDSHCDSGRSCVEGVCRGPLCG